MVVIISRHSLAIADVSSFFFYQESYFFARAFTAVIEHEKNSFLGVKSSPRSFQTVLRCRAQDGFVSLSVSEMLTKLHRDGLDDGCEAFCSQGTVCVWNIWTPLEDFSRFV